MDPRICRILQAVGGDDAVRERPSATRVTGPEGHSRPPSLVTRTEGLVALTGGTEFVTV
jgi:hypothetical protein